MCIDTYIEIYVYRYIYLVWGSIGAEDWGRARDRGDDEAGQ